MDLEYRVATLADKAQVSVCHGAEVGSIYSGLDYVAQRYEATLSSPNKVAGLCFDRAAGIVVGYGQIFVFDNDRHMLLTALRVHQLYQGRGIATELRNFLCRETRKKFPKVSPEVRFGVYKPQFSSPDFYAQNPDYQMISKRHYYLTEFPLSELRELRESVSQVAAADSPLQQQQVQAADWTTSRRLYATMLADAAFQRLYSDSAIAINFEVLELDESNLAVLPGRSGCREGDSAPLSAIVAMGDGQLVLAFGCILYCRRGLRADIDLYCNGLDRADFSSAALAGVSAGLVAGFLARLLAAEGDRLAGMPEQSLSLFVSLDCYNRGRMGPCSNCDLESRLADSLRSLISDRLVCRHPFYSEGCPYALLKRKQVCAYLRTQSGKRVYTTCFAYKQRICGADSQFEYDCCPGYGHDSGFEGYTMGPKWPRRENCLKRLGRDDLNSNSNALMQRIGADAATANRFRRDLSRLPGQLTAFLPYNETYKPSRFDSSADDTAAYIVQGSHFARHLLDGVALPTAEAGGAVKISRYSNGIICAECRRFVSADHSLDGRAVVHFVDGFIYPSRQSLAELLSARYPHFWSDVPAGLQATLGDANCGRWYTVLVPSQSAWTAAKSRAGTDAEALEKLLREHILPQLVCSSAVCQDSLRSQNLNGESVQLSCEGEGRVFARSSHEFGGQGEKAYMVAGGDGEFDQMASNGVVHETDRALLHSSAISYRDIPWPDSVPDTCISLDPAKKYIFLIPRDAAWQRFKSQDTTISPEESMKKFSDWYATDSDYRCLVRQYHVLEAANDQTSLDSLWSQVNPASWPIGRQPGSYRTLARWPGGSSADATRRNGYGYLQNQLHFQKADNGPRLHYQFAPVRNAKGFALKEGHGYMVDWVNIPPHENATDFFKRRADLSKHLSLVVQEKLAAQTRGHQGLFDSEGTVQLIIVSKDNWYNRNVGSTVRNLNSAHSVLRNTWNLTDFLLLNWGNLHFWLGDLGFLAKGEKVFIQSGHPNVLIGVYRHTLTGKFHVWNEIKAATPEDLQSVQSRWQEIVEYNHFKTDAVIWIVNSPFECSRSLCKWNTDGGRVNLPWTFAAACGDFVTFTNTGSPPLSELFAQAGGKLGIEQQMNVTTTVKTGRNRGNNQQVSCFMAGMVAARSIVFEGEEGEV